jgi:phosphoserine phosphatase
MCELERSSGREQVTASREEMAGWYRAAGQPAVEAALAGLKWAPGTFEGVRMLQDAGVTVALASVTWSFAVEHIAGRLGVADFMGTTLDFESGVIGHAWGSSKAQFLQGLCKRFALRASEVAAVGDTSGDYDMLRVAGKAVFVGPFQPDVPGAVHLPNADIRDVARAIIGVPAA